MLYRQQIVCGITVIVVVIGLCVALACPAQEPVAPSPQPEAAPAPPSPPLPPPVPATPQRPHLVRPMRPAGQVPQPEVPDDSATSIVPVVHGDPDDLSNALKFCGVQVLVSKVPQALIIRGTEDDLAKAKDLVKQLDVPPQPVKNVEVTIYLLTPAKEGQNPALHPCPPALDSVKKQTESTFGFPNCGLMDTLVFRCRDGGEMEGSGVLPAIAVPSEPGSVTHAQYKLKARVKVAAGLSDPPRIELGEFMFGTELEFVQPAGEGQPRRPQSSFRGDTGIKADVDVQSGQVALVGQASVSAQGATVFVVICARVL